MKTTVLILAAAATVAGLAQSPRAAEPAKSSEIFIYATYFHCNAATLYEADDAVAKLFGPEFNKLIKEGVQGRVAGSWGWLAKKTGGEWSRARYLTGPSLEDVSGAASASPGAMTDVHPPHVPQRVALDRACPTSEDYIWRILAGNDARGHRGKAAFSTYYVCDQSRETQADALVKQVLGPKYDDLVRQQKLTSWGWAEHIVGGKYRRLGTMSAPSLEGLMKARQELVAAAEHDPIGEAFTSICGSHQDYIWEIQDQGPP